MDQFSKYTQSIPQFTIDPTVSSDDFNNYCDKYVTNFINSFVQTNAKSIVYNQQPITIDDFKDILKNILLHPLDRVSDSLCIQKIISTILDNPKNQASYIDQLLVKQLDLLRLPYPDPITAIYDYETDVKPKLINGLTDELKGNLSAYLTQYLPLSQIKVIYFNNQNEINRILSSINIKPNKLKKLLAYSSSTLFPIVKLDPDIAPNSPWRLLNELTKTSIVNQSFGNLVAPTYFMLINEENLKNATEVDARTNAQKTAIDFNSIIKFHMIKTKDIASLPSLTKNFNGITHINSTNKNEILSKLVNSYQIPRNLTNPVKMANALKTTIDHFTSAKETQIKFKAKKNSFLHQNRRHPDDINLPGRKMFNQYRPNLMIHLDTSGSVSEDQYQGALISLLAIAKKYNMPVYFQSFSHYVSDISYLDLRKYTVKQSYEILHRIPKVNGGTEYENVWSTINKSPDDFIHFMITDFEYAISSQIDFRQMSKVVNNLYYVAFSNINIDSVNYFAKDMYYHHDYTIFKHILV